jgi:hypothetical protein
MTVPSKKLSDKTVSYRLPLTVLRRRAITCVKLPDTVAAAGTAAT